MSGNYEDDDQWLDEGVESPKHYDEADEMERDDRRTYSISELVTSLNNDTAASKLPPALERRIRDFRFAQQKRREKYGDDKPWGIMGLYVHLADIR
jgi:hypothetical protein